MAKQEVDELSERLAEENILYNLEGGPDSNCQQASQGKGEEEVSQEVEDLFCKVEARNGITKVLVELKKAVQKVLSGENMLLLKVNILSNHHLMYEVLEEAGKKLCVLFLNKWNGIAMRKIIPRTVRVLKMQELASVSSNEVLIIENCEMFEELPVLEMNLIKSALTTLTGPKVLLMSLVSMRSYKMIKEKIGVKIPTMALQGVRIDQIHVTSSKDENKRLSLKNILKTYSNILHKNDNILMFTRNRSEAKALNDFIVQDPDINRHINVSKLFYGSAESIPTNEVFTLVIFFSFPKKIEQILSLITWTNNEFYYTRYGKLKGLPKIYYHVICTVEDYIQRRYITFSNKITKVSVQKLVNFLQEQRKNNEIQGISLKQLAVGCDLTQDNAIKIITLLQTIGLVNNFSTELEGVVFQYLEDANMNSESRDFTRKLKESAKKVSNGYSINLRKTAASLNISAHELGTSIKKMSQDGSIKIVDKEQSGNITLQSDSHFSASQVISSTYQILNSESTLENELQKWVFLIMRYGYSHMNSINLSSSGPASNLISLIKKYLVSESIENVISVKMVEEIMSVVRCSSQQVKEAYTMMMSILVNNRKKFMKKEIEELRESKSEDQLEHLAYWIVRTLCGEPPASISLFDMNIPSCQTDFKCLDLEKLTTVCKSVLNDFMSNYS